MPLPENIRQAYLGAMGLDSYFPRHILPGAPAPRQCQWPPEWREQGVVTLRRGQSRAAPRQENAADLPPAMRTEGESAKDAAEGKGSFQCTVIRVDDRLCAIQLAPATESWQQPLEGRQRKLLENIIKAMGWDHRGMRYGDMSFRWTLPEGRGKDGPEAAELDLLRFLEGKLTEKFSRLLIIGAVTPPEREAGETGGEVRKSAKEREKLPWQAVFMPSLDAVLAQPQLKKSLWRQLARTFRQAAH